ncbi:MAG: DUF4255 domain-containing protein [Flavobacteriales bacterium]|nr:DUF4255 domain-containing protein [Flavobacteriales bacterium]
MIQSTLEFLKDEVKAYLDSKVTPIPGQQSIVLSNVADKDGKWAIPENSIGISLIHIEEERVFKEQKSLVRQLDGTFKTINPEIKLNLYVLFTSNAGKQDDLDTGGELDYKTGLTQISNIIEFFQGKNVFTNENAPNLYDKNPNIEKLVLDLYSHSFEELYNYWSVIGTAYLPSVLYKARVLRVQRDADQGSGSGITEFNFGTSNI